MSQLHICKFGRGSATTPPTTTPRQQDHLTLTAEAGGELGMTDQKARQPATTPPPVPSTPARTDRRLGVDDLNRTGCPCTLTKKHDSVDHRSYVRRCRGCQPGDGFQKTKKAANYRSAHNSFPETKGKICTPSCQRVSWRIGRPYALKGR
ncbi:hypothetical protein CC77DRAFT_539227 [Alternaria alternata]|uniref:Uncharacterized protein n=1 Tax=Alternaria alternata TaxID=5599 RepID=A0A177DYT5_ALTAL|nr:hypothetical protein CC77DRAFT_539227 [Alternaria alternata]OAG24656.1 hypothetical protein CC77DRAFT_539227 [Alternaria alternata]